MPKHASLADRFWEKVRKTRSCWVWTGQRHDYGYGRLETYVPTRKVHPAHRLSWIIHVGAIPDGMSVLHRCDNPSCVNPAHLFLGTQGDNARDMREKHRNAKGEKFPHAKLTESAVMKIRRAYASGGVTQQHLADLYGVSISQINGVVTGKAWTHVAQPHSPSHPSMK